MFRLQSHLVMKHVFDEPNYPRISGMIASHTLITSSSSGKGSSDHVLYNKTRLHKTRQDETKHRPMR